MNCAIKIAESILFLFNLIISLISLMMIGLGVIIILKLYDVDKIYLLFGETIVTTFSISSIIFGLILFVVAFVGCCGIILEKYVIIIVYAAFLLTILVIEIIVGGYSYCTLKNVDSLDDKNTLLNPKYFKSIINSSNMISVLESSEKCCGIFGPDDYFLINNSSIPATCCPNNNNDVLCSKMRDDIYETGCFSRMQIKYGFNIIMFLIFIGIIEVSFIISTLCLAEAIQKSLVYKKLMRKRVE